MREAQRIKQESQRSRRQEIARSSSMLRLCEFPMPEATIEIPVQMERVSAVIAETLLMLYQNQKRRLRLLFDSCFCFALRMGTLGISSLDPSSLRAWGRWGFHPQTPDKGFHPLTLLCFAPVFRYFFPYSKGYFTPHCARSASINSITRMVSLCGISGHSIEPSSSAFMQART